MRLRTRKAANRWHAPQLSKCPQCGKSQLRRLMSAPVFRLKGGGWYETDFKGDQDNKRNLADRPETDAAESSDGAKDSTQSVLGSVERRINEAFRTEHGAGKLEVE